MVIPADMPQVITMHRTTAKLGFYGAIIAFLASVGYDVVQILQIVRVLRPPVDAITIYGFSLLIPVPFILAMLALHYTVPDERKIWTHGALLFTVMYATYVILNYTVQLATVIPASLRGTLDQVRILDQTPHSLFWDADALGYIFLGLATLLAAPAFEKRGIGLWARGFFIANAVMTPVIAFVYFYPTFSYRLLLLGAPWIVTASGSMLLLALYFRQKRLGTA